MRIIPTAAVFGTVLTASLLTAAPAVGAPKVPDGCTFSRGLLTCVRPATTVVEGPFSTGGFVSPDTVTGGFTGQQICAVEFGHPYPNLATYNVVGAMFTIATSVTTTTQHGVSGKSPVLTSTTTPARTLVNVQAKQVSCFSTPPAG